MKYDLKEIEKVSSDVAKLCGKIILGAEFKHVDFENKTGIRDLVTEYDVAVQKLAIEKLSEKYPKAVFFAEEGDDKGKIDSEMTFVIDPIDGTANFANNMNISCISIACFLSGVPSVGVVYNPYTDELFCGAKGCGATLNSMPIKATENDLEKSLVLFGTSPYNLELFDRTMEKLRHIFPKCLDVRRCGAAALDICSVAAGKAGLFFEEILATWDFAAGLVILEEAGGTAVTTEGNALPLDGKKTNIIAGSRKCIEQSGFLANFTA